MTTFYTPSEVTHLCAIDNVDVCFLSRYHLVGVPSVILIAVVSQKSAALVETGLVANLLLVIVSFFHCIQLSCCIPGLSSCR